MQFFSQLPYSFVFQLTQQESFNKFLVSIDVNPEQVSLEEIFQKDLSSHQLVEVFFIITMFRKRWLGVCGQRHSTFNDGS